MLDPQGNVASWNAGAERIQGYTADEIIGQHFSRFYPSEAVAADHCAHELKVAEQEGRYEEQGWCVRKDGSRFMANVLVTALRNPQGRLRGFAMITRDITERNQAEERLRLIVDRALDAVVTINERGLVTRWNPQAEIVFGWRAEEAINAVLADLIIPPQYRQAHHAGLAHFLECGEGPMLHKRMELNALHKEGRTFPVELAIAPIRLGDHYEFSAFVRDITERKQWEIALRDTNERLEKRVEERTAQLAHQSTQLQRANEALTRSNLDLQQFAYVASHDLQAPLRGISGFVQALQAEYEGQLDEQADEWIARTLQATKRAQSLIQDLLRVARVDSQARPFLRVSLDTAFDSAISLLEAPIRESGAQITRGELPTVMGDRAQLVQLMQNLMGNALKFHGDKLPRLHVGAQRSGKDWTISVRDNGIGIDSKYHARIFELFQRLHTQQEYPGTGIGLAVCARIVRRHGGRIWVESEPGQGSVFYFTIPEGIP
jgi:PAS domain S-box-containing protein